MAETLTKKNGVETWVAVYWNNRVWFEPDGESDQRWELFPELQTERESSITYIDLVIAEDADDVKVVRIKEVRFVSDAPWTPASEDTYRLVPEGTIGNLAAARKKREEPDPGDVIKDRLLRLRLWADREGTDESEMPAIQRAILAYKRSELDVVRELLGTLEGIEQLARWYDGLD
jgi:hypothetical protein